MALATELGNGSRALTSRQLAGIYLKNVLKGEEDEIKEMKKRRWLESVDAPTKAQIREVLLNQLLSSEHTVRHTAAQCIGALAAIDVPAQAWPELLPAFQAIVCGTGGEPSKEATLEACGYMLEELDQGALDDAQTNTILTSIVDGIKEQEGRPDSTRRAAVVALQGALEFCNKNFAVQQERHVIMGNIFSAIQSGDERTRVAAYECLSRVAVLYYDKLPEYMEPCFQSTLRSIQTDSEEVGMMALEFWSTICEEEIELLDMDDVADGGAASAQVPKSYKFISMAVDGGQFVPVLLQALTKQDEDADDEPWNLAAAAAVCLELIANTVRDKIVQAVLPFVMEHITNQTHWRFREAATMAFGSILEGPQTQMKTIIEQSIGILINALNDSNDLVKDTTAWTLSRICELHPRAIPQQALQPLMERLVQALKDVPRVAEKACTCIHHMAEATDEIAAGSGWMSHFYVVVLQTLFQVTERPDWNEFNLRTTAYEAITMMIENHPPQCREVVKQTVPAVLQRLKATFESQIVSGDDRDERDTLQALLVATLHMIVRSLDTKDVVQIADSVMELLLHVLNNRLSSASEEAFMAIGAVIDKVEKHFDRYLVHFMPILIQGLQRHEEHQVCSSAVGVVGDLCRALEVGILPYCDDIVKALLEDLQSSKVHRSVKPGVLSAFGDIALATAQHFEKYLEVTMTMLIQASTQDVPRDNDELVEFLNELREGVLDAFTGIINGLADGNKVVLLVQPVNYVEPMAGFLQRIAADADTSEEPVIKGAIGVVGDLAKNVGKPIGVYLAQPYVTQLFHVGRDVDPDLVKYAQEQIQALN